MISIKKLASLIMISKTVVLGLASFLLLPTTSFGASASIAFASDDAWGWATGKSQIEANQLALKQCAKTTKTNDCTLRLIKGIAYAEGREREAYGWSEKSLAEAKISALKSCAAADCKVTKVWTDPGFFSLFRSDEASNASFFLSYGYKNSDVADQEAKAGCEKNSGHKCNIVISSAIPGSFSTPKKEAVPVTPKSCRPHTQTVSCTSKCVNGNCEVTYKNGCKMRIQVPAQYDPFNNQWTYPAPSC